VAVWCLPPDKPTFTFSRKFFHTFYRKIILLFAELKIDTTKMKKHSFLMVLIGIGEIAYRRTDGVYVVPLGCLKD